MSPGRKSNTFRATPYCGILLLIIASMANGQADPLTAFLVTGIDEYAGHTAALPDAQAAPWLEDPELRVSPEVDAKDLWTQTYSLRFRPTSARERRFTRSLSGIENQLFRLESAQARNQRLARRYRQLLGLASLEMELALSRHRQMLSAAELTLQRTLSTRAGYNAARLQQAALNLELREGELQQLKARSQALRATTVGTELAITDWSKGLNPILPGLKLLEQKLQKALERGDTESTYRALVVSGAQQELSLAETQRGFGLNLMELSFENKGIDSYNVTLGFRLPNRRHSPALARRARDLMRTEREAHVAAQQAEERSQQAQLQISRLRMQHDSARKIFDQSRLRSESGTLSTQALQQQQRHELKLMATITRAQLDMAQLLIDALARKGQLDVNPFVNWLRSAQ